MPILVAIELLIAIAIAVGVFSQIVIPLWRGTKMFPLFRRQGALEAQLDQARQEQTEAELEEDVAAAQQRLRERRSHQSTSANPPNAPKGDN